MKQLTLSQIIAALPDLYKEDRNIIRAAIDELAGKTPSSPLAGALYEAVVETLGVRLPWAKFTQGALYKHWPSKCNTALYFIEETFPNINKVARASLMRMLVNALIADLKAKQVTPSVRSVVLTLDTLPQQFDNMFPGYRENGLAHLVLDAITNSRGNSHE